MNEANGRKAATFILCAHCLDPFFFFFLMLTDGKKAKRAQQRFLLYLNLKVGGGGGYEWKPKTSKVFFSPEVPRFQRMGVGAGDLDRKKRTSLNFFFGGVEHLLEEGMGMKGVGGKSCDSVFDFFRTGARRRLLPRSRPSALCWRHFGRCR